MADTLPTQVEVFDSSVGTAAVEIFPAGNGTTHVLIKNDDASDALYVGWSSALDHVDLTMEFISGSLAAGGTLELTDYRGAIWLLGAAAGVDYRVERRYVKR